MPEKNGQQMDAQQKLRHWMDKIPGYTKELFTPERFPHLLDVMLQYSRYGFDNAVLIAAQCREKEIALAERGMWEKKYGRHVKDGGEGIQVIVPTKNKKNAIRGKTDPKTKKPEPGMDGKAESKQEGAAVPRMHVHTVYNVSQTEGRPLPERPVSEMRADADNFDIFIKAITALSPVPVNFAEFGSGKQEYSFNADGEIVIQKGMGAVRTMQTAARTVARALIDEFGQMMEPSAPQGRETVSIETESVAYMFCRYVEMDADSWHFEDIAGWHDSIGFEALQSTMNMVRKVSEIFNGSMVDSIRQEMMRETRKELYGQVYYHTAGYARENGELDAYRASRKENIACREAVEQAIKENFDGMHLKQGAVGPVMEAFGAERVAYVLASTVKYMEYDGRFSRSNKSWAHTVQGLRDDDGQNRDAECDFVVGSHPGVLDLFINLAREYISGLEKAETGKDEVETEKGSSVQITAAVQEQQKLPPVSDMREPEAALGNLSRAEIEETVFSYVQATLEDAGIPSKVELLGVRVYGSRSRDGMYAEGSDLDVAVSYKGEIREDELFNLLHAEKFQIAGLDVDINPISTEKTGTLEDYLENADKYLDMKEAQMRESGQETAPRQEERAEQISFFVAECAGQPVAGRYREGLTLQEAVELYQKISKDKVDSVPGIGFRLEGGGVHDGDHMLMADGKIQKDDIMRDTYLRDNLLVKKAVMDLEMVFPDKPGQAATVTETQKELEKEPEKSSLQENKDAGAPSGADIKTSGKTGKLEKEQPAGQQKGMGKKESVLKALREHQAKINGQEKGKTKQKTQARKKGVAEL